MAAEDPLAGDVASLGPGDPEQRAVPAADGQPVVSGAVGESFSFAKDQNAEDALRERSRAATASASA